MRENEQDFFTTDEQDTHGWETQREFTRISRIDANAGKGILTEVNEVNEAQPRKNTVCKPDSEHE
jgi:hypothetical protein